MTACYRFAGALGLSPAQLVGASLRDLWGLYCGKMESLRYQVLWQASILFREKLDAVAFIRRGQLDGGGERVTMPDSLREKVEAEIGRMNGVQNGNAS